MMTQIKHAIFLGIGMLYAGSIIGFIWLFQLNDQGLAGWMIADFAFLMVVTTLLVYGAMRFLVVNWHKR